MKLLFDTTFSIDVLRNKNGRRELLAELVEAGHKLGTSAMNVGELYSGMRPGEERAMENFLARLECYPITDSIARLAGSLKDSWARRGVTLALQDMIVAATAIEHGCVLVTDNGKDFPDLQASLFPLPKPPIK
jgi:predicted nucleic acid-binding protein